MFFNLFLLFILFLKLCREMDGTARTETLPTQRGHIMALRALLFDESEEWPGKGWDVSFSLLIVSAFGRFIMNVFGKSSGFECPFIARAQH